MYKKYMSARPQQAPAPTTAKPVSTLGFGGQAPHRPFANPPMVWHRDWSPATNTSSADTPMLAHRFAETSIVQRSTPQVLPMNIQHRPEAAKPFSEADRMADTVMRMPDPKASQRQAREDKGRAAREGQPGRERFLANELTHSVQQPIEVMTSIGRSLIQRECQYFSNYSSPDTYCETEAEARGRVTRANPRDCFLYRDGPAGFRWRPIPGYGCAHYVAHQLNIGVGQSWENCREGKSVTIAQITEGRVRRALSAAAVNDIWTNSGESHSGVVITVGTAENGHEGQVQFRACNTSGNIYDQWTSTGVVHQSS